MSTIIDNNLPGIQAPLAAFPETAKPLMELAQKLLFKYTPKFSQGERELVAAFVSKLNDCHFCYNVHREAAAYLAGEDLVSSVLNGDWHSIEDGRLWEILALADSVHVGVSGAFHQQRLVELYGLTPQDVHDVVLITAAFNLYNRYVTGLGGREEGVHYPTLGRRLAEHGYVQ